MSSRSKCLNNPDVFCYICGEYVPQKLRTNITDFVKKAYFAYFHVKLGDQDKLWAPHKMCKTVQGLRMWTKGERECFKFGVPMVWREPKNHHDDCYFCMVNVKGYNRYKKQKWEYPDLESARRPVPHGEEVPVPVFSSLPDVPTSDADDALEMECGANSDSEYEGSSLTPQQFSQNKLNDLVRDLSLSKQASELLASRLKEKN